MRRAFMATVLFVFVSGICVAAPSNEDQIRKRIDDFAATWNKHDATALAYFWSVDGDLINPFARKAKGLTEIQKLFQTEHSTAMKQSTFKVNSVSIRFIEPTLALVDADAEISDVANPDGTTATIKPHLTNLMRKSGGQWWIVAARAFIFQLPPPPPAPAPK